MNKYISIALVATLGVVQSFAGAGAQGTDEPAETAVEEKSYDVSALLSARESDAEINDDAPSLEISVFGVDSEPKQRDQCWWRRATNERFGFAKADELYKLVNALSGAENPEDLHVSPDGTSLVATCSPQLHARISAALELIDALANTDVRVELRRLPRRPDSVILTAKQVREAGGVLVGQESAANGKEVTFSTVKSQRITYGYESSGVGSLPQTGPLTWGEQWSVSTLALPDGRLRLQAWHARADLLKLRELDTIAGRVQLPKLSYDYTPGAGVIENGGGIVLDTAVGAYLLTAWHESSKLADWSDADWRLVNPAGWLAHDDFVGPWFMRPEERWAGDEPTRRFPELNRRRFTSAVYSDTRLEDAAEAFERENYGILVGEAEMDVTAFGPIVYLYTLPEADLDDPELAKAARREFNKYLDETRSGPPDMDLRLVLVSVPRSNDLPDGVVKGAPSAADIASLLKLRGAATVLDRRINLAAGQRMDVAALQLQNYLGHYSMYEHYEHGPEWAAHAGTTSDGVQVCVCFEAPHSVQVLATWRPTVTLRETNAGMQLNNSVIQTPEGSCADLKVSGALPPGHALSCVQSLDENTYAVFVIQQQEGR
ncbi:MAG: hypothetical protein H6841_07210 [Planctomycetes bacterium]|nr:hypothetical protein [Planctomycetota bacterium]MCB9935744.1 hypothetical protein [Planctomycetota bacterium]